MLSFINNIFLLILISYLKNQNAFLVNYNYNNNRQQILRMQQNKKVDEL
ncbi:hypothetical protein EBME_2129 [bacterium endosymbiont of Mortierella elongata FMR23-6]|nr:hypothetical protein EBME_2129 [bacterium endosymbiont of Mortierella elongata FMR23-6]